MGVVYEARDPNLDRPVAIKTIRVQGLSADAASEYEVRFRTEARSAARLHHPNIVSVFELFARQLDVGHHFVFVPDYDMAIARMLLGNISPSSTHTTGPHDIPKKMTKPSSTMVYQSGRVGLARTGHRGRVVRSGRSSGTGHEDTGDPRVRPSA